MRSHHLWVLNELCNIDKHMRILAYGAEVKWYFRKGSPIASSANFDDADDQGRGILSIPLSLKAELAAEPPPTFKVVFGDAAQKMWCRGLLGSRIGCGDLFSRFLRKRHSAGDLACLWDCRF